MRRSGQFFTAAAAAGCRRSGQFFTPQLGLPALLHPLHPVLPVLRVLPFSFDGVRDGLPVLLTDIGPACAAGRAEMKGEEPAESGKCIITDA